MRLYNISAAIHPLVDHEPTFSEQRWARRRFEEIEGHWERACFTSWAEWTSDQAAEKLRKLERAGRTLRNLAAYRSFRSWKVSHDFAQLAIAEYRGISCGVTCGATM